MLEKSSLRMVVDMSGYSGKIDNTQAQCKFNKKVS